MFLRPHHLLKVTTLVLLLPYRVLTATDDDDSIDFTLLGDDLTKNAPSCQRVCLIECRKHNIPILSCKHDPTMDCATNTCLCGNEQRYNGALERLQECAELNCDYETGGDEAKGFFIKYCDTYYNKDKASTSTTRTSATKTPTPTSSTDPNDDSNNNSDPDTDVDSSKDETPSSSSSSSSTSNADSGNGGGGGGGSSFGPAEIAGTVIGAVSAIAAIVGICMQVRHKRKKANLDAANRPSSGGNQEPPEVTQPMVHHNHSTDNYNPQTYPPVGQNYGQQHTQPPANQSTGYLPQKYPMVTATPPPPDNHNYNQHPMDNGHMQQQHNPGYNEYGFYAPTPPPQQFHAPPPQQGQRYQGY